jgi:hypothetical protein
MQKARPSFMKWFTIPVKTLVKADTINTYYIDLVYIVLCCIVNKTFICSYLFIGLFSSACVCGHVCIIQLIISLF